MEQTKKTLPPEAYRELKPGEKYIPYIPAESSIQEVTGRSIFLGSLMAFIFTFAAAYLGLKVGQVFEAAIPIAILAVGIKFLYRRRSTILENVIIQSIGAASGVVVAGAIFTTPALFILDLNPKFLYIFISAFLGGCLGIFFLIPLRKYFCAEQHGKLPFPEATATTEILVSGEAGGAQAKVLVISMLIGGIYDFLASSMKLWNEIITFQWIGFAERLKEKARMVLKLDALAALFGLGYIVGLRYSSVIVAGSFISNLVIIPLIWKFGQNFSGLIPPGTVPISEMSEFQLFRTYAQKIGIGAIATAGFIGIIKYLPIMVRAFSIGFKEIFRGKSLNNLERTQLDLKMSTIIVGLILTIIALFLFFSYISGPKIAIIGVIIVVLLSFLFTTVAAYAIAIVGTNPVSGMTLVTLIISSIVLISAGLSGRNGMAIALLMGSAVCTALSVSGGFITDLKIGYWLGATPRNQQRFKFLGILISALIVGIVIFLLDKAYPFKTGALPAPQANLMATIISSLMSKEPIPWFLYGLGAIIALTVEMAKVPTLAFALGMYIPMELNTPLFIGGLVSYILRKSSRDEDTASARVERGTLIASGFIAGGALMGVLGAILKILNADRVLSIGIPFIFRDGKWVEGAPAQWFLDYGEIISLLLFVLLSAWVLYEARKGKK
ncbi:MAG: OPT family oligopeptide transporter [Candidatus Aminicenantia bacterium]